LDKIKENLKKIYPDKKTTPKVEFVKEGDGDYPQVGNLVSIEYQGFVFLSIYLIICLV
jgi:hypothetical protein